MKYKDEYWGIEVRDIPIPIYPKTLSLKNLWQWYPKALYRYGKYGLDKMHERTCPVCERHTCNEDLSWIGKNNMAEIARRLGCHDTGRWGMNKSQLSEYIIMKVCKSLTHLERSRYMSKENKDIWLALMYLLNDPDTYIKKMQDRKSVV